MNALLQECMGTHVATRMHGDTCGWLAARVLGEHVLLQECKSEDNLLGQLELLQMKTCIVLVNARE